MLPPTAVTQGESSQAAVAGLVECPALAVGDGQVLHAPQSPVATSTGIPSPPRSAHPGPAR